MGPIEFTSAKLGGLEIHLLAYYEDHHVWPDSHLWKIQLKPYFENDGGFSLSELTDVWGEGIEYLAKRHERGRTSVVLRSRGPNKMDDNGTNDDVVLEVFAPALQSPIGPSEVTD